VIPNRKTKQSRPADKSKIPKDTRISPAPRVQQSINQHMRTKEYTWVSDTHTEHSQPPSYNTTHNLDILKLLNTTSFSHHAMISFTSSGSCHSAQCDVFTCLYVKCGTVLVIPFPRCGGNAESFSAWINSNGAVMRAFKMASSSS
jgi:hypothetical protein